MENKANKKQMLAVTLIFAAGLLVSQFVIFGEHRFCRQERDFLTLIFLKEIEKAKIEVIQICDVALAKEAEMNQTRKEASLKIDSVLKMLCEYEDAECYPKDSAEFQKKKLFKASFATMQDLLYLMKKDEEDTCATPDLKTALD